MHVDAIERILQKIGNIIELIKMCDSVRLYCCSLLLVYESDKSGNRNFKVISREAPLSVSLSLSFTIIYLMLTNS